VPTPVPNPLDIDDRTMPDRTMTTTPPPAPPQAPYGPNPNTPFSPQNAPPYTSPTPAQTVTQAQQAAQANPALADAVAAANPGAVAAIAAAYGVDGNTAAMMLLMLSRMAQQQGLSPAATGEPPPASAGAGLPAQSLFAMR
jgi:hypothetical protein